MKAVMWGKGKAAARVGEEPSNLSSSKELKTSGDGDGRAVGGAPPSDLQPSDPGTAAIETTKAEAPVAVSDLKVEAVAGKVATGGTEVDTSAKRKGKTSMTNAGDKDEEEAKAKDDAPLCLDESSGNLQTCGGQFRCGEGSIGSFCRISPIVARPPKPLAAVLPWVRKSENLQGEEDGRKRRTQAVVLGLMASEHTWPGYGAVATGRSWSVGSINTQGNREEKNVAWATRLLSVEGGFLLGLTRIAPTQSTEKKTESIILCPNLSSTA